MIQLIRQNYNTYLNTALGKPESHFVRLAAFFLVSIMFSLFTPDTISGVYSMMATGITVLTGFTFTALFSDHALASSGLPAPKTENDRIDLLRLVSLSKNFRARSSYFITLSILEVVLLAAVSFSFVTPAGLKIWLSSFEISGTVSSSSGFIFLVKSLPVFSTIFSFVVNFIYLECLYTFYRMAETILAILDTRRTYLSAGDDA